MKINNCCISKPNNNYVEVLNCYFIALLIIINKKKMPNGRYKVHKNKKTVSGVGRPLYPNDGDGWAPRWAPQMNVGHYSRDIAYFRRKIR